MRPLIYLAACSLDGFIATPDGGLDWLPTDSDFDFDAFLAGIGTVLMGRATWQVIEAFDGPYPYPATDGWVFSHSLPAGQRGPVTVTAEDPIAVTTDLKRRPGKAIWLVGGGRLATTLRRSDLIDEYRISVVPVLLGDGIPLFAPGGPRHRLVHTKTRTWQGGLVEHCFERTDSLRR